MLGNELLSPTAARFFPAVTRRTPVATSLLFSIASPLFRRGIFPSRCAIPFVCRVTPFIHCGILLFLHSPPPAHRGILLSRRDIIPLRSCVPFSHHRPPPIFYCISSLCCRISLSHRGIFFVRCSILLVCCITSLSRHNSFLFRRYTLIVRCKRPFYRRGMLSIRP